MKIKSYCRDNVLAKTTWPMTTSPSTGPSSLPLLSFSQGLDGLMLQMYGLKFLFITCTITSRSHD